jgi:uncharacterized protein (DUF111 family)
MARGAALTPDIPCGEGLHLHMNPVGGAAGDMFVSAMLDAFPALEKRVMADVAAILPPQAGHAALEGGMSGGMAVRRLALLSPGEPVKARSPGQGGGSHHDHEHEHSHVHDHHHGHGHSHVAHHRHGEATTYRAMRALIEAAPLSAGTADAASAILHLIAEAEAKAHDLPIGQVHFHELADWDALMDVTAAGSITAALAGATWSVASLPLGGGLVQTAHGALPVPAPATAHILRNFTWHDDGVAGERVTPTGAAIIAHLTGGKVGMRRGGRLVAIGMGAGTRDLPDRPNILRITAFSAEMEGVCATDRVVQLACDIDDMTGEEIGAASTALRALPGVADLVLLSGQGKKGRPVTRLELLVDPEAEARIVAAIFDRTSTLGLRRTEVGRVILQRQAELAANGVRIKRVTRPSGETSKAESDDLDAAPTLAARRAMAYRSESG